MDRGHIGQGPFSRPKDTVFPYPDHPRPVNKVFPLCDIFLQTGIVKHYSKHSTKKEKMTTTTKHTTNKTKKKFFFFSNCVVERHARIPDRSQI